MAALEEMLHSAASYQKLPGTLVLSSSALSWTPSSSSSASPSQFHLPLTSVSGLSMSKAGSATVALQVAFDEEGVKASGIEKAKVLLTFTGGVSGDRTKAEAEREAFKERLVTVIADNRARKESSAPTGAPGSEASSSKISSRAAPTRSAPGAPRGTATAHGTNAPRGNDRGCPRAASTTPFGSAPSELNLRISLLKSNPLLAALHRQTVMTGMIPDSEFWSHPSRQALLRSARQAAGQRKGRNARIVDPRFSVGKNGELKLEVTDEDRRDLLEQNDVLRLVYTENVPEKLDEASFWQRYFTSSLYHVLRTSSRSSSLLHSSRTGTSSNSSSLSAAVKPDDIFDSYLPLVKARYSDTLDPPSSAGPLEARNRLIDLGATESDHGPTGNEKDWTMRGGAEKSALPLVRRFNEHSERVLGASLGKTDTAGMQSGEAQADGQLQRRKRARTEGERGVELEDHLHSTHAQRYEEEIVIEDLEEKRERMVVPLDLNIGDSGPAGRGVSGTGRRRAALAASAMDLNAESGTRRSRGEVLISMKEAVEAMPANGVIQLGFLPRPKSTLAATSSGKTKSPMMLLESELRELLLARRQRSFADFSDLEDATLRKQVLNVQRSATEVLRQFWNAISPPDKEDERAIKIEETTDYDGQPDPAPTSEEREARAKRMMQILGRVQEQAHQVIESTGGGTDEDRVATVSTWCLLAGNTSE